MPELSVVIVATDNEQRALLQVLVDGTSVARTAHGCASFPVGAADPVTRRVRAANPDVTVVDIPSDNPSLALRAIELLHQEMPDTAVFAVGSLKQPQVIVNAMRAGAREFIERPTNTTDLLEAFVPLAFLPLRSRAIVLAIPGFAEVLASREPLTYTMGQHYAAVWVPYVLVAFVIAGAKLFARSTRSGRRSR